MAGKETSFTFIHRTKGIRQDLLWKYVGGVDHRSPVLNIVFGMKVTAEGSRTNAGTAECQTCDCPPLRHLPDPLHAAILILWVRSPLHSVTSRRRSMISALIAFRSRSISSRGRGGTYL